MHDPPAVAPRSRVLALVVGTVVTWLLVAAWQPMYRCWFPPDQLTGLLALAGLVAGSVTSVTARTYYSGNPALAYALGVLGPSLPAWLLAHPGTRPSPVATGLVDVDVGVALTQNPEVPNMDVLACTFALLVGLVACIIACWAADTSVNFPRAYPDPSKRPRSKDVSPQVLGRRVLPGTVLGAGLAAGACWAGDLMARTYSVGALVLLVVVLLLGCRLVFERLAMPGSLWSGVGPLAGLLIYQSWQMSQATLPNASAQAASLAQLLGPLALPALVLLLGVTAKFWAGLTPRPAPPPR